MHFQTDPGPGQARPLPARRDLRRRRRPAPRLADLRAVGGARPRRRAPPPALGAGRLRPRLPGAQRGRRRRLQADLPLRPRDRIRDRLGRPRRRDRMAGRRSAALRPRQGRPAPRRGRRRRFRSPSARPAPVPEAHYRRPGMARPTVARVDRLATATKTTEGTDPLAGFSARTRSWFERSFEAPTPAQAWAGRRSRPAPTR